MEEDEIKEIHIQNKSDLDAMGNFIATEIRDKSIDQINEIFNRVKTGIENRSYNQIRTMIRESGSEPSSELVLFIADTVIAFMLGAFEESDTFAIVKSDVKDQKENFKNKSNGLEGELYHENGWFARFSKYGSAE